MSQIPTTMKAFVQHEGERAASVQEVPVPKLGPNDVLVEVAYAAQNPTDWKHSAYLSPPHAIMGCDFSGTIVSLGSELNNPSWKVGDKVSGSVHGGQFPDKGSHAQYLKAESDLITKVPEGLSLAEASTFGIGWFTTAHALIYSQKQPWPPAKVKTQPFLIYGASSSVGLFAVQLATLMGYKVIAVCSSSNFELVKSFGAADTFDYHDKDKAIEEIKSIYGDALERGLDCISEGYTFQFCAECFGPKGGQLNVLLSPGKDTKLREDVKVVHTLMYTLLGKAFEMNPTRYAGPDPMFKPADPDARAFGVEANKRTPELIKLGIKPNPVDVREGLEAIQGGWDDMKSGKVSAKKLVYRIGKD